MRVLAKAVTEIFFLSDKVYTLTFQCNCDIKTTPHNSKSYYLPGIWVQIEFEKNIAGQCRRYHVNGHGCVKTISE